MNGLLGASLGTLFPFLMTTLGSAMVFFFRKEMKSGVQRIFLGFAAGVMIAASMWGLLTPAIEESEQLGIPGWLPAAGGFALGVLFLMLMDVLLPHLHPGLREPEGMPSSMRRSTLMMLAVTLHNIPEGWQSVWLLPWQYSMEIPILQWHLPWLFRWESGFRIFPKVQRFPCRSAGKEYRPVDRL